MSEQGADLDKLEALTGNGRVEGTGAAKTPRTRANPGGATRFVAIAVILAVFATVAHILAYAKLRDIERREAAVANNERLTAEARAILQELTANVAVLERKSTSLKQEVSDVEAAVMECSRRKAEAAAAEERILALTAVSTQLEATVTAHTSRRDELKEATRAQGDRLQEIETKRTGAENRLTLLNEEIPQLEKQRISTQTALADATAQLAGIRRQAEVEAIVLSNTLSRARQAQTELEKAANAHRAVQAARDAAAAAAETAEKALSDATIRLQTAERDEAAIRTRLTALRKEHDEALTGMKPLIEKGAMLEEQAKRAEEAAGRLTGIQQATKVAQKALADGETALAKLRPETAALEQRKAVVSQELEAAKTDLVEIQARLTVLREEHRKQSEEFRNQNEAYLELLKKRIEDGSGSPKGEAPKKDAPSLK